MTYADYINLFAAWCLGVSALCWMLSAQVNIRTGYDMDEELAADLRKAAKLNGIGAGFASVAAFALLSMSQQKLFPGCLGSTNKDRGKPTLLPVAHLQAQKN